MVANHTALLVGQTSGSTSWREVRSGFGLLLFGFFKFTLQPDPLVDRVSWSPSVGGQSGFISPFFLGKPALTSHSSALLVALVFDLPSCWACLRATFLFGCCWQALVRSSC